MKTGLILITDRNLQNRGQTKRTGHPFRSLGSFTQN